MLQVIVEEKKNWSRRWLHTIPDGKLVGSQAGLFLRAWLARLWRKAARPIVLLALLSAATAYSQQSLLEESPQLRAATLTVGGSTPSLAFGRYLASIQERNVFTESGPVGVEIEASLPDRAKQGSMLAVRQMGDSERSVYRVIRLDGDSTVKQQVIARYLAAEEQAEALPYSSVEVTPANYKFHYVGSLETNGTAVYVFQIAPKKKRVGMIRGQIWIDSVTGVAVHQAGRFVKRPSVFIRQIEVTRDTNLRDGLPDKRTTHVVIDTRLVGRAELTITERPLQANEAEASRRLITQGDAR
jgi:hypothetical protein